MTPNADNHGPALKRLDEVVIQPGDIILTTTTAAVSRAIRIATRSDISHAMVGLADTQRNSVVFMRPGDIPAAFSDRPSPPTESTVRATECALGRAEAFFDETF